MAGTREQDPIERRIRSELLELAECLNAARVQGEHGAHRVDAPAYHFEPPSGFLIVAHQVFPEHALHLYEIPLSNEFPERSTRHRTSYLLVHAREPARFAEEVEEVAHGDLRSDFDLEIADRQQSNRVGHADRP